MPDGSTWALVPGPGPNTGVSFAYGVSCSTTVTCVSVGYSDNENTSTEQTLVETESPAVPIVNAVSPNTGFTTGGTSVTITGSGFTDASEVDFNGVAATDVVVDNDSSITAVTPAESAGVVDVTVTTPGGLSTVSPADLFTYTVDASPTTVSCDPETPCSDSVNSTLDNTSVSVTGNPGASATGSESLVVNTDTLSCGSGFDYPTAVSTLSSSGFSPGATLTVTENVGGEPSTSGLKTCFEAAGSSTATILKACKHGKKFRAPCQQSLTESAGTATATLAVPANDPRFWVGGSPINLKSFSPTKGKVGSTVTLKGLNLTEVTSVVMGGVRATVKSSNAAKVVVIVPEKAVTGYITVTADSGSAVSALPFTVT
jgi:hypothetical protein